VEAVRWIGERRTARDVLQEVLRDRPFYRDGGGMTLTGGEPTAQPAMAEALLRLAKAENISTAIETCGHAPWNTLERLLPYLDLVLYDLKNMDSDAHRAVTGVSNERILSNLRRLAASDATVRVRVPLIPGFNATEVALRAIGAFVKELNSAVTGVDLLPYHAYGRSKYDALARPYPWEGHQRLTDQELEVLAGIVASYGLNVNIGG
jgi:pyruvate formate lyase activating enzyme